MSVLEIIGGILIVLCGICIISLVLMQQSPKGDGISSLTGGDSYLNQNTARTKDAMLFRFTKIAAALFFILTIGVYAVDVIIK